MVAGPVVIAFVFNPSFPEWSVARSAVFYAVVFVVMAALVFGKHWYDNR